MKETTKNNQIGSLRDQFKHREKEALRDFFTFLEFESISTDPEYAPKVRSCAVWLSDYIKKMGFEVELWPTIGYPIIFASYMHAGPDQPTLLIYNHYDVQPVDPLEGWTTPPFQPTIRNGEIYARGAQDNKGQCFYTIQALRMLLERDGKLPINVKLCIEGEEECGSIGLSSVLDHKRKELEADYLAIVDVGLRDRKSPAVTLGVRGIVTMHVDVHGSKGDLHSGSHGGVAYNPLRAIVEILESVRDKNGRIVIPGFYDDVSPVKKEELSKISLDFDERKYEETFGIKPTGGEKGISPAERAWLHPAFEINGISGGYSGHGFKTVIPAHANAKVSCRLVPNQDPQKIGRLVARYLESKAPPGITVKVHVHPGGGNAIRANPSSTIAQAFSKAYSETFDKPCQFIFEGGSIPIVAELAEVSKSEVVLVGLGLPDDQIHAPNEHFGVDRIAEGAVIVARAIELLKK